MQCTCPQLARLAFRDIARPRHATRFSPRTIQYFLRLSTASWLALKPIQSQSVVSRRLLHTAAQTAPIPPHRTASLPPFPNPPTESSAISRQHEDPEITEEPMTHAQTGRIAARAIRMLVQKDNISGAFLIVKALQSAQLGNKKVPLSVDRFLGEIKSIPMVFDSRISPRLPSHTLVHSLVRIGSFREASRLAEVMMKQGIRVRCKTLEAIMLGFQHVARSSDQSGLFSPVFSLDSAKSLGLQPMMAENTAVTRYALALFEAARKSGQRRSHNMFKYLITLCIINGEIILASLLFGMLLRDWQARELSKAATTMASKRETPFPDLGCMKEICDYVNWQITADQTDENSQIAFKASLQALAHLAYALDRRLLPFNVDTLITTLYRCPHNSERVWVPGDSPGDPPRRVNAYGYFHGVLDRLLNDLPSEKHDPSLASHSGYMLPPLNLLSYNSLLHYSLRERHSLARAKKVLLHMTTQRYEPLDPNNSSTLNIIQRSRKDFPKGGLSELMAEVGINPAPSFAELARLPHDECDCHALSTCITSLITAGRPQEAVDALPALLPGLFPLEHDKTLPPDVIASIHKAHREECMQRAVGLGPVVFTSILNAVRKTGMTGLAERVFLYALEAENNSWTAVDENNVIKPWCLPVHAYTTMIQVYGTETKKGHALRSPEVKYAQGWGLTEDGLRINHAQHPKIPRYKLARRMILMTYRLMKAAPEKIAFRVREAEHQGLELHVFNRRLETPEPDLWCFDAIMKIFVRMPWDPIFASLKKEMERAGFEVPEAYDRVLKKHWDVADEYAAEQGRRIWRRSRDAKPFAFPRFDALSVAVKDGDVSLPVMKTKRYVPSPKMLEYQEGNWENRMLQRDMAVFKE